METLIIIDFQKDFANIDGSLHVDGALFAENEIFNYINKNHENISDVVFTVDWHSPNHRSFKRNGGIWPDHCLQYSEGAGISDNLMSVCIKHNIPIKIFVKGNIDDCEEYGAFDSVDNSIEYSGIIVSNIARNSKVNFNTFNLVFCGIAGDYCVKESINNILTKQNEINNFGGKLNISVFKNGIASIDDGTTIDNFIKENNLNII